jgi:hypothetical protein
MALDMVQPSLFVAKMMESRMKSCGAPMSVVVRHLVLVVNDPVCLLALQF